MAVVSFPEEKVEVDIEKAPPRAEPARPAGFDPTSLMSRQLLDVEEANYRSAAGAAKHASYAQGQALVRINELELFKARGYDNFKDYVEQHLGEARNTAVLMMAIARAYTPEQLERITYSAARAGLRLLNATPEPDTVNDLFAMVLRFDDGTSVRFIDATVKQIDEFIRQVKRRGKARVAFPEADFASINAMADNLKEAAADVELKLVVSMPELVPVDAPPPEAPKLKVDLSIKGAPMDELPALFETLADAARKSRETAPQSA